MDATSGFIVRAESTRSLQAIVIKCREVVAGMVNFLAASKDTSCFDPDS